MNILAIETSTSNCSIALSKEDEMFLEKGKTRLKHSDIIIPMITRVLDRANLSVTHLGAVAFSAGPGSFTGLRIACAVAQGIGFVNNIPVIPISSMKILALAMKYPRVFVSVDARLRQVYCAAYESIDNYFREVLTPKLYSLEEIPPVRGNDWVGCGSGFDLYQNEMLESLADSIQEIRSECYPNAIEILREAKQRLSAGSDFNALEASPFYLREKVAKKIHEQ